VAQFTQANRNNRT